MISIPRLAVTAALALCSIASPASATPIVVNVGQSFTALGTSIVLGTGAFASSAFTFFASGDLFSPTAVQTTGGAEFRTVFGGVSTDFLARGSGILTYGPGLTYAAVPLETTVSFSNGDNYFGLQDTVGGINYYGYAFTTNNVLNSYGYETTPNTAFVVDTNPSVAAAAPEPAPWMMMIAGVGAAGLMLRRRGSTTDRAYAA